MPPCGARDDACVPAPGAHTDQAPRAGPAGPSFRAPEVWGPLPRSVSSSHVRPRRGSGAGELGKRAGAGWAAGMARTGGTGRASDPQQQHRRRIHGDPTARDSGHPSIDLLPEACPGSLRRRAPPTGAQGPGRAPIHSTEGRPGARRASGEKPGRDPGPGPGVQGTRVSPWPHPQPQEELLRPSSGQATPRALGRRRWALGGQRPRWAGPGSSGRGGGALPRNRRARVSVSASDPERGLGRRAACPADVLPGPDGACAPVSGPSPCRAGV